MQTLLTKSQKEFQQLCWQVFKKLEKNTGYIKGYGKEDRLMTGDHSPIENISRKITQELLRNGLVKKDGFIFIMTNKRIVNANEINITVS